MHLAKRHLPKHARSRLIAWALAMLMWLSATITGAVAFTPRHERQRAHRMSIAHLLRLVKALIIARAVDFARLRRLKRVVYARGRPLSPRGIIRALIGSRLRRMLKRKRLGEQIGALIHAVRHLDAHAQHLAKRMRRRLTRLMPLLTAPSSAAPLISLTTAQIEAADSS